MSTVSEGSALEAGAILGRYELLAPIAQGGMAAVWAARQSGAHGFQKTVAIKTMLPTLGDDPEFERMFLAEGRTAMRVHHPNVVQILDLGEEGGVIYLVMEWLDGESLSTLMKAWERSEGQPLPLALTVLVAARACRGLHAAHEVTDDDDRPLGLVHRDVSPQNLMTTYDGHVKVVDFGVAKSFGEATGTQAGQFKGKIPYMAPEQVRAEAVDRRTDIFAMGTLMYRLITGRHPFLVRGDDVATLRAVAVNDPSPIDDGGRDVPPELAAIVVRCLAKDRDARYPDMSAVANDLESVLVGLGGASAAEPRLAEAMRSKLGDARKRRRAAMRDAAKRLGWALATSESNPRVSLTGPSPEAHTRVSARGMEATPQSLRLLGPQSIERVSDASASEGRASHASASTPSATVLSSVRASAPSGRTSRTWIALAGLGGALVAGGGLALALAVMSTKPAPSGASATTDAPTRAGASSGVASGDRAIVVAAPASPSSAPASSSAAEVASGAPSAKPVAARTAARPTGVTAPPATDTPTAAPSAPPVDTGPDLGF